MNYRKELNDPEKAFNLDKNQIKRLHGAIEKAYDQEWHEDGPNNDQIFSFVAPYIKSQEEAFYTAVVILSDTYGAMMSLFTEKSNSHN